jgi:hypothetical protein
MASTYLSKTPASSNLIKSLPLDDEQGPLYMAAQDVESTPVQSTITWLGLIAWSHGYA